MVTRPFYLLRFVELRLDQLLDGVERVALVRAVRFDEDAGAAPGGEQQDAEDRLAVDLLVAFPDLDVRLEPRGSVHELRGSARVKSQFVLDLEGALRQRTAPLAVAASRSDATRIAFDPFSVIVCASVVTSFASCCTISNFTISGRLTPVSVAARPRPCGASGRCSRFRWSDSSSSRGGIAVRGRSRSRAGGRRSRRTPAVRAGTR